MFLMVNVFFLSLLSAGLFTAHTADLALDPTVRARPERPRALRVFHSKSGSHGALVWARRALNGQKTAGSVPGRNLSARSRTCCQASRSTSSATSSSTAASTRSSSAAPSTSGGNGPAAAEGGGGEGRAGGGGSMTMCIFAGSAGVLSRRWGPTQRARVALHDGAHEALAARAA
jgi:hypothetical protein